MMLRCVIVEDLSVAAEYLSKCCEKAGNIQVTAKFSNVADALSYLNENPVDLIFLDVEMPEATGFDLLDQLAYLPKVILTTSKPEYAYPAFEYKVVDFLKKPYTYQRFSEAIAKLSTDSPSIPTQTSPDHIFIKSDGKLIRLNLTDILFIESMGDYVKFVTADKKFISHHTIKNLEEKVPKQQFIRVHRSYIVNIARIDDIRENFIFIQGNEIPVSKSQKPEILKRLNIL
ncbi:LytR/AlgR family response regulator transcription factor [Gynurincola endophyticus]|uniref:LytR/AlgR family response regulator transcription factor n=1 Tax=Gynurincola endophyticus TaxID=2479004 RepID=UPI000F8EE15F|nr:LytTR family DNA-binding domain-containing protein [Gynurincola endophyticus]